MVKDGNFGAFLRSTGGHWIVPCEVFSKIIYGREGDSSKICGLGSIAQAHVATDLSLLNSRWAKSIYDNQQSSYIGASKIHEWQPDVWPKPMCRNYIIYHCQDHYNLLFFTHFTTRERGVLSSVLDIMSFKSIVF